jgi:hypothetical protein
MSAFDPKRTCEVRLMGNADVRNVKPRRSGAFKLLSLFRPLAGSRWLGLRSARLRMLRYAIVGEVTPPYEVDGGVLLGRLGFA